MSKHWKYFKYLMRHKWYVFKACIWLDVPLHRAIIHDWSKFLPCEWLPYATYFYGGEPVIQYDAGQRPNHEQNIVDAKAERKERFDRAWLHHQHQNPHHWQHWVLRMDSGDTVAMQMPNAYVREMVADWIGAGLAITGRLEVAVWYKNNKDKMVLHPATRLTTEMLLTQVVRYRKGATQ